MKLSDLLNESVVKVGLESEDKEELFAEMIELLVRAGRLEDRDRALQAILAREEMATTGIGSGVAVPHGKEPSIKSLLVALGISKKGIEYDATDGEPVYLVFLVLAEANNPGPHVQCLGEIARLLQVPGLNERLRAAKNAREVLDIIRAEE
ncbi:MAG TPA: PTS sugar transporter subunit IIA [Planctomycetota bacterium]|nr:PTS sugar transporter subunit IIA [Planctomycetota bacterium]HRR78932.1 PTS sugar transporter subunit IIA [Planctomycetota bacterium]HRT92790.1 PTS sugar transporter subunit IIA [Planctomycetota bacterium]